MSEQYSTKRLLRPLENWFARVVEFAREGKRWWASYHDKKQTRDMPPPRPRGPSEQNSAGPSKHKKKSESSQSGKKDEKKDSNTQLAQDATNSKKDAGEAKGPSTHSRS